MNEKYLIGEEGVKAYVKENVVAGYEFGVRVPYYFGIPLSQIANFQVCMDGQEEDRENVLLIMDDGEVFKLNEISTVSSYHWPYGKKMRVAVLKEGGLAKGSHKLELDVSIAVIYSPRGFTSKSHLDFSL